MAMTRVQAIKTFFESSCGRKVTMDEMKALTADDRKELADLAIKELGETLKESSN